MPIAITQDMITAIRYEIADTEPSLPILADVEIEYLLNKHSGSVRKASLDAARIVLLKLSQSGDEIVGILSIKGSKAAEQYRLALELYLKNPLLNPVLDGMTSNSMYVGGISKQDIKSNEVNPDTNYIPRPVYRKLRDTCYTDELSNLDYSSGAFGIRV